MFPTTRGHDPLAARSKAEYPHSSSAPTMDGLSLLRICLIIAYRLRLYLQESAESDDDPAFVEAFAVFNEIAAKYGGYDVW
jgi:hypothetical protein